MYCFRHDSRWGTEWKTPRRIRFCVSVLKKRSTRFSHEELVGTKWNRRLIDAFVQGTIELAENN